MSEDVTANVGSVTPAGSIETAKLSINLLLYGIPADVAADNGAKEFATGDGVLAFKVTVQVTPEEATRVHKLIGYLGAVGIETQQGDSEPNGYLAFVVAPQKGSQ